MLCVTEWFLGTSYNFLLQVIVTILTAPNLSESAKMLSRWIQVADQVIRWIVMESISHLQK
jgi:hypothetical protein